MVKLYHSFVLLVGPSMGDTCVSREELTCINKQGTGWPKCDPSQSKPQSGRPDGFEYGDYCNEDWTKALNEMLSSKEVDICGDTDKIARFLGQLAHETGYFSTLSQPADGGAGMIHMIPDNFETNAMNMERVWGADNRYQQKVAAEGAAFFTESPENAWRSAAAWYIGGSGVKGCTGQNLFDMDFDKQSVCIYGQQQAGRDANAQAYEQQLAKRKVQWEHVKGCMKPGSPAPPPAPLPPKRPGKLIDPECQACQTFCDPCQACVGKRDGDCSQCWRCNDYNKDKESDKDHCHALDKKHKFGSKVQCLSEDGPDCRSKCWGTTEVFV